MRLVYKVKGNHDNNSTSYILSEKTDTQVRRLFPVGRMAVHMGINRSTLCDMKWFPSTSFYDISPGSIIVVTFISMLLCGILVGAKEGLLLSTFLPFLYIFLCVMLDLVELIRLPNSNIKKSVIVGVLYGRFSGHRVVNQNHKSLRRLNEHNTT